MYRKCSVQSFSNLCLGRLATTIVNTLNNAYGAPLHNVDVDEVRAVIQKYLARMGTPWNIYQDLLRVILCSNQVSANIRFACLQLLLNHLVTMLITDVFPATYYERVLQVITAQGTGLRVLDLKGVWVKDEHMHYMYQIVRQCTRLQRLIVPYIANDELLLEISQHSRHLGMLDITGEVDITEIGLEALSKGVCSKTLTFINLGIQGEDNLCFTDVALILQHCPNVETLATYSYTGHALHYIHTNIDVEFKCKLRYLHDIATDDEIMNAIVRTCPHLDFLYLNAPKSKTLHHLNGSQITKLKLHKFNTAELLETLKTCGTNMTGLTLIKGYGGMDVSDLMDYCPNLIELEFYLMPDLCYTRKKCTLAYLDGLEMLSSPMSMLTLKSMLYNLTCLKRLAIDHVEFNDEDFVDLFVEHFFEQIEDIWFTLAPELTVQSVELLLEQCPQLQNVGQLSGWNLSHDDMHFLRTLLRSGNSSVRLQ